MGILQKELIIVVRKWCGDTWTACILSEWIAVDESLQNTMYSQKTYVHVYLYPSLKSRDTSIEYWNFHLELKYGYQVFCEKWLPGTQWLYLAWGLAPGGVISVTLLLWETILFKALVNMFVDGACVSWQWCVPAYPTGVDHCWSAEVTNNDLSTFLS